MSGGVSGFAVGSHNPWPREDLELLCGDPLPVGEGFALQAQLYSELVDALADLEDDCARLEAEAAMRERERLLERLRAVHSSALNKAEEAAAAALRLWRVGYQRLSTRKSTQRTKWTLHVIHIRGCCNACAPVSAIVHRTSVI